MRTVDMLARALARNSARPFRGTVYRWVNPAFPLPRIGPGPGDCPTAGAYIEGGRLNAKGAQAPLYAALEPEIVALGVVRYAPLPGEDLDSGGRAAARFLVREGFQFFAIELELDQVLDLGRHQDLARRYLEADWQDPFATCQGPHPTVPSQEHGLAAFMAGFEAVLKLLVFVAEGWGGEAWLLDLFRPRPQQEACWTRLV